MCFLVLLCAVYCVHGLIYSVVSVLACGLTCSVTPMDLATSLRTRCDGYAAEPMRVADIPGTKPAAAILAEVPEELPDDADLLFKDSDTESVNTGLYSDTDAGIDEQDCDEALTHNRLNYGLWRSFCDDVTWVRERGGRGYLEAGSSTPSG